jgi:selenide, water dikinase
MTDAPRPSSLTQGGRNGAAFGAEVDLPADLPDWRRHLLTDPQTSGGLPVTCAADRAETILARIRAGGYPAAARIGRMEAGPARIRVNA